MFITQKITGMPFIVVQVLKLVASYIALAMELSGLGRGAKAIEEMEKIIILLVCVCRAHILLFLLIFLDFYASSIDLLFTFCST